MLTIHKYSFPLRRGSRHTKLLPVNVEPLDFQNQRDELVGWFEVDTDEPTRPRTFEIVGTGQAVPKNGVYLATVQETGGEFVWHVYEVPTP